MGANRDVMQTKGFLISFYLDGEKSQKLGKNDSVRKIVNAGLSKTPVRVLPGGTVWVDEPTTFVVSGVENCSVVRGHIG